MFTPTIEPPDAPRAVRSRLAARLLRELEQVATLPAPAAVQETVPILHHLLRAPAFLDTHLPGLLAHVTGTSPYVALRFDGEITGHSVQIFVWPAGAQSAIHDHSCWGAISCAVGALSEVRYTRLDAGDQADQAHLRQAWRRAWQPGTGISTLLPGAGGIHKVANLTSRPVLSAHIYGPAGPIDGRDYDPRRDFVCDRLVDPDTAGPVVQLLL